MGGSMCEGGDDRRLDMSEIFADLPTSCDHFLGNQFFLLRPNPPFNLLFVDRFQPFC
jgi:hypothetical protein